MNLRKKTPSQSVNPAYLKSTIQRDRIEWFKKNLILLLDKISIVEQRPSDESEEHLKNDIRDFLRDTFYRETNAINTKDKKDLVIHADKDTNSNVSVIIEAKRPSNKSEMVSQNNINVKAFHELILYYLRERISSGNLNITYLIITNINEWYIFDSRVFEKLFVNSKLERQFKEFEGKQLSGYTTEFFYKNIAEPFVKSISSDIEYTYFNLKDYDSELRNSDRNDDKELIPLFKLLSPESLLKLPFLNDSNSLNEKFYTELLHIIGLTENSNKLIERNNINERNPGSILENAISQLDSLDKIGRLEQPLRFGRTHEERLFNIALELSITWINRILFLKLLEAQLVKYHKGDKSYSFLNIERIKSFDDLNSLFFMVLAKNLTDRSADVKVLFEKVPYLNSSLFEPTEIEHNTLFISNLRDDIELPIIARTSLRDQFGKKRQGKLSALKYFFEFLDSYDFSSDGSNEIQEEEKSLINASVLGLIFEKINGYKDGSYFTPGFITMYMCKESITKSVINKFNSVKNWRCNNLDDLLDKIEDREEANQIFNSIRICDPAVGSGHFLVSALNQMIYIKGKLRILQDVNGQRLKDYFVDIVNDELIIRDEDGRFFQYNPLNIESQRVQMAFFHEKQKLIEQCLFGVDINPNSVKICRLRLWIELLKNSYYKNSYELETLPNIDINIKVGNSLVSRFELDSDLKEALKQSKRSIAEYKNAVSSYRRAESKAEKREMEKLISDIKSDFRSEISLNDPKVKRFRKLSGELYLMTNQGQLFEMSKKEKSDWGKKLEQLTKESKKLESEIEEIKSNKIYESAFEWRFEFPEVLNDDGDFIGFDVLIGNPPYVSLYGNKGATTDITTRQYFQSRYSHVKTPNDRINLMNLFIELSSQLLYESGSASLIVNKTIAVLPSYINLREFILSEITINYLAIDFSPFEAIVDCLIMDYTKLKPQQTYEIEYLTKDFNNKNKIDTTLFEKNRLKEFVYSQNSDILKKIDSSESRLGDLLLINRGVNIGGCFDNFLSKEMSSPQYFKYLTGTKNIKKYNYSWNLDDGYCKLDLELEESLRKIGKTLVLGDITRFSKEKIFIPESSQTITAVYSDEDVCSAYGIMVGTIKDAGISLFFITGLLNSRLINFYCLENSILRKGDKATPHVGVKGLNSIPVLRNDNLEKKIDEISKVIHQKKLQLSDTTLEEEQINKLIYELYGLTDEEIQIVENN
jgi:hypothetical protein